MILFEGPRFYDIIIAIILAYLLFKKKKSRSS